MKKLTAGDGYTYLVRHVAAGDVDLSRGMTLEGYYAAGPNPPGAWIGRGAPVLGLSGGVVSEAQMRNLFGLGRHPDAERIIDAHLAEHVTEDTTPAQAKRIAAEAQRAAALGRGFTSHAHVAPLDERVAARLDALRTETGREPTPAETGRTRGEESRRADAAVAGFDLVFAPPKSMALLWALHPDPVVHAGVERAHEEAMTAALGLLEEHAAFTRTGAGGVAQIATQGLTAAAFRHHDSRDGDPNLHTHVVVSNKVMGVDGVWRALDARGLHAMKAAAADTYNTQLTARVRAYTGADVTPKTTRAGREPVWEIAGVPTALVEFFSTRRAEIVPVIEELTETYRREHGRAPDAAARQAIGRQATLATRAAKKEPKPLPQLRAEWAARARAGFGRDIVERIAAVAPGPKGRQLALDLDPQDAEHRTGRGAREGARRAAGLRAPWARRDAPGSAVTVPAYAADLDTDAAARAVFVGEVGASAVLKVAEGRSTWSRWNVYAAAQRILRDPSVFTRCSVAEPAPEALDALVSEAVTAALDVHSVKLTPDPAGAEPAALRRADGASVFAVHAAERYTSTAVLAAEKRLVDAATTAPAVPLLLPEKTRVAAALDGFAATPGGRELDAGQRALVEAFAVDGRRVVAGIGPAGTGKTTAMRALNHALTQAGTGRLIPLATSARSAAVLAEDLGIEAENAHAFLTAHGLLMPSALPTSEERAGNPDPARLAQADVPERLRLSPGDVLLVDEAGMAGTFNLDRLLALAEVHGARLRLLGDDRQLAAVESGGALRLIASEAGAVQLDTVHRFAHAGEAAAAARIRVGDTSGLDHYEARGLITGGEHAEMAEAAYTGWLTDMRAGRTSLLITGRNEDVTALSARARADRIAAGQVEADGVGLHDGNTAGVGDWVVVRENDRRIRSTGARVWARNGEAFTVTARGRDGSLTARHQATGAVLRLPAEYVARAVELAYASTVHRAQGATVDTAHALITPGDWRESLYVALTRARLFTRLYVATHTQVAEGEEAIDQHAWDPRARTARTVLEGVLAREASEPAATTAAVIEAERGGLLSALVPRHAHAHAVLTAPFYRAAIRETLGDSAADVLGRDPQASAVLVQVLRQAHHDGWDPADALRAAACILPAVPVDGLPRALDAARAADVDPADARGEASGPVLAHRLARAVETLTAAHPAPDPQAPPTREDRARYSRALAERGIADHARTAVGTTPLSTPQALPWRGSAGDEALGRLLHRPAHQEPPRHVDTARAALDPVDVPFALMPEWDQVAAGLHRASLLGHDPTALLRAAARGLDPEDLTPVTTLAARVATLATTATPGDVQAAAQGDQRPVIDALARVMKAHETRTGADGADVLPPADTRPTTVGVEGVREQHARLSRALDHARAHAGQARREEAAGPLGWVPAVLPGTTTPEHAAYLHRLTDTIADRVNTLAVDALTADTAAATGLVPEHAPAPAAQHLASGLGRPGYGSARDRWANAAAVVAAHREQHHLTTGHPATAEAGDRAVLGPFPTTDAPAAYTTAYWYAAAAAIAARHDARPGSAPAGLDREQPAHAADPAAAESVRTAYRRLPEARRDEVAALVLGRLGTLPDPTLSPDTAAVTLGAGAPEVRADQEPEAAARVRAVDEAVTHPANTAHLRQALADLGYGETEDPVARARRDQREQHEQGRGAPETDRQQDQRIRRTAGPRPQQAAPEAEVEAGPQGPGYGVPQPGRPEIGLDGTQPRLRW